MADRGKGIVLRLSTEGEEKVKATLRTLGAEGQRALKQIENAGKPVPASFRAIDAAAGEIKGSAMGMVGSLGAVGRVLVALGPIGIAAGAGIAAVSAGLAIGAREFAEHEAGLLRLQAVIKATGYQAGVTAGEVDAVADKIAETTLATDDAARQAATVLLTTSGVGAGNLERLLAVAQDIAAVFGGDIATEAQKLARAIEDPANALDQFRRMGIVFSDQQRDVIKRLAETGDKAGALNKILEALESRVGGAGAAGAGGISGGLNQAAKASANFFEALFKALGVAQKIAEIVNGFAKVMQAGANKLGGGTEIEQLLAQKDSEWDKLRTMISRGSPAAAIDAQRARFNDAETTYNRARAYDIPGFTMARTAEAAKGGVAGYGGVGFASGDVPPVPIPSPFKGVKGEPTFEARAAMEATKKAAEENAQSVLALARAWNENVPPLEKYNAALKEIAQAEKDRSVTEPQAQAARLQAQKEYNDAIAKESAERLKQLKDISQDFASNFIAGLKQGKSVADSLNDSLGRLADRLLDMALDDVFNSLFKQPTASGGGIGGLLSGIMSLFGGGMAEGGPLRQGKWYMAGEHGVEPIWGGGTGAYAAGYPSNDNRGGGGVIVQNIDQRRAGSPPITQERTRGPNGEEMIRNIVRDEVFGGASDNAFEKGFGIRRPRLGRG